ncbi:MAG: glycosyltransferase family 39 protein, partial [Candidatus Palauibacterales bacterium]|nr:glycosyltransferase family 39 protein [Candidatus Palauibacterales bacterium]
MSASDRSTYTPGRAGKEDADGEPPAGSRLAAAALLSAGAAFLGVLGYSAWLGARFGFARVPTLEVVVQGRVSGAVELLSGLLEGASGVLALGAASAVLLAWGLGVLAPRPTVTVLGRRARRSWRDLTRMARDAARWMAGLPGRRGGWHAAALAAVVAGAVALRLLYLSGPVRYDEAFTFTHFAAQPAELGLARYTFPNNHLLHTLLVHLVTSALGSAPAVMRLPAFAAGVAVVPAAYAAWDALGDADEALVASAVAAVTTPLVLYSANARGYAIVALCSLLLVPLAARLLRRRDLAAWGGFCVVAAAAFHAIPIALYPVGAVLVWLVLSGRSGAGEAAGSEARRPRSELLREAGVAAAVIGVAVGWLYLPAVQLSGLPSIVSNRFVQPSPVGEFAAGLPAFFA